MASSLCSLFCYRRGFFFWSFPMLSSSFLPTIYFLFAYVKSTNFFCILLILSRPFVSTFFWVNFFSTVMSLMLNTRKRRKDHKKYKMHREYFFLGDDSFEIWQKTERNGSWKWNCGRSIETIYKKNITPWHELLLLKVSKYLFLQVFVDAIGFGVNKFLSWNLFFFSLFK